MPRGIYKRKRRKQKEPNIRRIILKTAKQYRQRATNLYKLARSL